MSARLEAIEAEAWKMMEFPMARAAMLHAECERYDADLAEAVALLRAVVAQSEGRNGHCHRVDGHWDRDGSPCEWCATWKRIVAMAGESESLIDPAPRQA